MTIDLLIVIWFLSSPLFALLSAALIHTEEQ